MLLLRSSSFYLDLNDKQSSRPQLLRQLGVFLISQHSTLSSLILIRVALIAIYMWYLPANFTDVRSALAERDAKVKV